MFLSSLAWGSSEGQADDVTQVGIKMAKVGGEVECAGTAARAQPDPWPDQLRRSPLIDEQQMVSTTVEAKLWFNQRSKPALKEKRGGGVRPAGCHAARCRSGHV